MFHSNPTVGERTRESSMETLKVDKNSHLYTSVVFPVHNHKACTGKQDLLPQPPDPEKLHTVICDRTLMLVIHILDKASGRGRR